MAESENTCTGTPTEKEAVLSAALVPPLTPKSKRKHAAASRRWRGSSVPHGFPRVQCVYSTQRSHALALYACIYSILPYMGNNTYANLNFVVRAIVTAHCILLTPLRGAYELLVHVKHFCTTVSAPMALMYTYHKKRYNKGEQNVRMLSFNEDLEY